MRDNPTVVLSSIYHATLMYDRIPMRHPMPFDDV